MQKMMTKAIAKQVPSLYETDGQGYDAIAYAHYFNPWGGWNWYMTEYDPATGEAFGLVKGFADELGYFSLKEFEEVNRKGLVQIIERDLHWTPCKLSEVTA